VATTSRGDQTKMDFVQHFTIDKHTAEVLPLSSFVWNTQIVEKIL